MRLNSKTYIAIGSLIFLIAIVFLSVYMAGQVQDIEKRASVDPTPVPLPAIVEPLKDKEGDGTKLEEYKEDSVPPILKSLDQEFGVKEIEQVLE